MAQGGGAESSRTSIVLLSKTGNGKSSLANGILSKNEFDESRGMQSGTTHCKCISTHARGRDLSVVDTPGVMDVSYKERAKEEIMRAISFCPDGFDVFLLVVKCNTRFTDEEKQAIEVAAGIFGAKFYEHAIVVFSHGDDYDNNETEFKSELEGKIRPVIKYLDDLLTKCDNRLILMDNGRRCDKAVQEKQIGQLMSLIDSLMKRNGNVKYTNEHFQTQKRKREQEEQQNRLKGYGAEVLRYYMRNTIIPMIIGGLSRMLHHHSPQNPHEMQKAFDSHSQGDEKKHVLPPCEDKRPGEVIRVRSLGTLALELQRETSYTSLLYVRVSSRQSISVTMIERFSSIAIGGANTSTEAIDLQ